MSDLYPLLMSPEFDPRPWGTFDLSPIYPNARFSERIGEAWLTGDHCKVANGRLQGASLSKLSSELGRQLVGDTASLGDRFPLLLKFLFPQEKLSVQVHPDDDSAQRIGEPCGKTECWYVAHAKPGAQIGLGLKPGTTRAQFERAIFEQRAEELLNWVNVFPGEMIYVAGGTVHTLGAGSIIVETQQQSDTTYRLYDYGRPRTLHLEQGLAVIKEQVASGKVVRAAPSSLEGSKNRCSPMVSSTCFTVDHFELKEPCSFVTRHNQHSAVQILVAIEGCGIVETPGAKPVTFARGDAVVIPAAVGEFSVQPQWTLEFLKSYVPGGKLPDPVTRM
jgi:mannose-6-phosphate isomerase